jgi:hypothetical protein
MTTTTERAASRMPRAAARCATIAREARSILLVLIAGAAALVVGGLNLYAVDDAWPHVHGFALTWSHWDAAWNAFVVFLAVRNLPAIWRWVSLPLRRMVVTEMSDEDAELWESAQTLADIGNFTALWLEGQIGSQPGYAPGCGPDEETADLIPVLAACNRAGFVTDGSQPGESCTGYDGASWEQRAGVSGFACAELAARLRTAAEDAHLYVRVHEAPRWRFRFGTAIPVTRREGRTFTRFGARLPVRHLRDGWTGYGGCSRSAVREVCSAKQVTIVDPEWGRNDRLWPALERFARQEVPSK